MTTNLRKEINKYIKSFWGNNSYILTMNSIKVVFHKEIDDTLTYSSADIYYDADGIILKNIKSGKKVTDLIVSY